MLEIIVKIGLSHKWVSPLNKTPYFLRTFQEAIEQAMSLKKVERLQSLHKLYFTRFHLNITT